MRRDMIATQPSREPDTALHAILLDKRPRAIFNQLSNLSHPHAGSNRLARVGSHLTMNFCSSANGIVIERGGLVVEKIFAVFGSQFLRRRAVGVAEKNMFIEYRLVSSEGTRLLLVDIILNLADRILSVFEEVRNGYRRRLSLRDGSLLLLFRLLLLCHPQVVDVSSAETRCNSARKNAHSSSCL